MRELKLTEWADVAKSLNYREWGWIENGAVGLQSPYPAALRVQVTRLPAFFSLTQGNAGLLGSSRLSIIPSRASRELTRETPTWTALALSA